MTLTMADVPLQYGTLNSVLQTPAHLAAVGKVDYRELVNELRKYCKPYQLNLKLQL